MLAQAVSCYREARMHGGPNSFVSGGQPLPRDLSRSSGRWLLCLTVACGAKVLATAITAQSTPLPLRLSLALVAGA